MADRGRRGDAVFFIYDHNMLKKEEDDLKDAILFFTPDNYSIDDQCALCGQLMGISEFLKATLSRSAPRVFRFEHDKFALKRAGAYTFGMKGGSFIPDSLLFTQLTSLYETFITYHGSIDSLKLRCKESVVGFLQELESIWRTILQVSKVFSGHSLEQTFQSLPYIELPKSGSHLFLQASHLLQSSQRRPYVLAGTILYKNGVLSTQLPPKLTKHLIYLQNQVPHIIRKTDCALPVGCRVVTLFLTDEELSEIKPLDSQTRQHCKVTDFSVCRQNDKNNIKPSSKSFKNSKSSPKRRLTCPNLATNSVPQKALQSYLTYGQQRVNRTKQESVTVDNYSWSSKSKLSLSHVPIVECRNGESPVESDNEVLYARIKETHFGESYKEIATATNCDNEQSETDSEGENNDKDDVFNATEMKADAEDVLDINSETLKTLNVCNDNKSDTMSSKSCLSNLTDTSVSSESNKDKSEKLEDSKSEEERSPEPTDLQDNLKATKCAHAKENNKNSALKGSSHPKREVINLPKVTETEENPSISDFDDDTEDEKTDVISLSEDVKSYSDFKDSSNIEKDSLQESCIKNKESSKDDIIEHQNVDKDDKLNSVTISDTSIEGSSEISKTGMVLSNSSSDVAKSRFYDGLSDAETKTLEKSSGHSIHRHTVDVHINTHLNSGTGEHDSKAELEGHNVVINVNSDSEKLQGCEDDNNKYRGNGVGTLKENNGPVEDSPDVSDSLNILTEQTVDNSSIVLSNESKHSTNEGQHSSKGESVKTANENSLDKKENIDPNEAFMDTSRYESEIETEDEGVTIATIEPCINCLDLASSQPDHRGIVRCSHCIAKFNKQKMFGDYGNDQEVINFGGKLRDRYESGTETEGQADVYDSGQAGSMMSSFSSDVSTDSTISRYWTHEMDGLNDVTLYVQCHSDISLLLLMENPEQYEENLFHSLWKGSLAHLADLDFYIKDCLENEGSNENYEPYRYLKFDTFAADLKGTIADPGMDRRENNLHQMLASLHTEFQQEECLSDVILRSHFNSCYGHSNQVEETYFQSDLQQKLSSGFPIPKDPVFNLDTVARQQLAKDKHLSFL